VKTRAWTLSSFSSTCSTRTGSHDWATADIISEPMRQSLVGRMIGTDDRAASAGPRPTAQETVESLDNPPKIARLITCRWCAGVWIAGGVVLARSVAPRMWQPIARGMALSAGAALLAGLEDD